jgi:hypothetical protein
MSILLVVNLKRIIMKKYILLSLLPSIVLADPHSYSEIDVMTTVRMIQASFYQKGSPLKKVSSDPTAFNSALIVSNPFAIQQGSKKLNTSMGIAKAIINSSLNTSNAAWNNSYVIAKAVLSQSFSDYKTAKKQLKQPDVNEKKEAVKGVGRLSLIHLMAKDEQVSAEANLALNMVVQDLVARDLRSTQKNHPTSNTQYRAYEGMQHSVIAGKFIFAYASLSDSRSINSFKNWIWDLVQKNPASNILLADEFSSLSPLAQEYMLIQVTLCQNAVKLQEMSFAFANNQDALGMDDIAKFRDTLRSNKRQLKALKRLATNPLWIATVKTDLMQQKKLFTEQLFQFPLVEEQSHFYTAAKQYIRTLNKTFYQLENYERPRNPEKKVRLPKI